MFTRRFKVFKEGATTEGAVTIVSKNGDNFDTDKKIRMYSALGYTVTSLDDKTVLVEPHPHFIGSFYLLCLQFIKMYKIGGNQKLSELIGHNNYYKIGKDWTFANRDICNMPTSSIIAMCEELETVTAIKSKSILKTNIKL